MSQHVLQLSSLFTQFSTTPVYVVSTVNHFCFDTQSVRWPDLLKFMNSFLTKCGCSFFFVIITFILPSIFFLLSWVRVSVTGGWAGYSWPPSPLRFLLGNPRYIIPPVSSGSTPRGLIPSWTCPENLKRKAPTRHPDQMPKPSSLAPFDEKKQRPYSELPLGALAPHVISQDRIILSASVRESSRA